MLMIYLKDLTDPVVLDDESIINQIADEAVRAKRQTAQVDIVEFVAMRCGSFRFVLILFCWIVLILFQIK